MRKNLTNKAGHIAIKKNEGLEAFKRQYGYESDEEVYRSLRRIASAGADDLFRKLKKSGPKQQEKNRTYSSTIHTSQKEEENEEDLLEKLKQREQELEAQTPSLEKKLKGLECRMRVSENELKEREGRYEELKKKLLKEEDEMNILSVRLLEIEKSKANVEEKLAKLKIALAEVRTELMKHEVLQIWVFESGEIELENNKELIDVPAERSQDVFNKLILKDEVSNLTIRELKTLATISVIFEKVKEDEKKAQVIFENERAQEVWDSFHVND